MIVGALDADRVALFSQLVLAVADGARMQHEIAGSPLDERGESLLRSQQAIGRRLVFEMTELGVVCDIDAAGRFAQLVRAAGAGFATDSFGLHGEAFRCLELLKPAYLKLNRALFGDLANNREDQFLVSSIVKIARPLQIRVIAQAIEGGSMLPLLASLGIDGYQGYASGRPARIV